MGGRCWELMINMLYTPFYDPKLSYENNYQHGPFGKFAGKNSVKLIRKDQPKAKFLNKPIWQSFGIPAGPLLNAKYCQAAFQAGFDLCVYKTVRTQFYPCHVLPNVVPLQVDGDLTLEKVASKPVIMADKYREPLTITNSFGVPSMSVEVWQPDMKRVVESAGVGQVLIGSFQGTKKPGSSAEDLIADYAEAARLVVETGAPVIEANLSCPNEGTSQLLCFDTDRVARIVEAIRHKIHNHPLLLKLSYFSDRTHLAKLIETIGDQVDGLSSINTIPARIETQDGQQALPGENRLISGTCGDGIRWAGLEMTKALFDLRQENHHSFVIVGVGGVMTTDHYQSYLLAGADAVMSATGAIWNPYLATEIWTSHQGVDNAI